MLLWILVGEKKFFKLMFYVVASLNLMFSLIKHLKIWRHPEWQKQKNLSCNSKHPPFIGKGVENISFVELA